MRKKTKVVKENQKNEQKNVESVLEVTTPIDAQQQTVKALYRGYKDIQKVRIATGNRIVASLNSSVGVNSGKPKDDIEDKDVLQALKAIELEYKRIADAYAEKGTKIKKVIDELNSGEQKLEFIKSELDYYLVESYRQLCEAEDMHLNSLKGAVQNHPMWDKFFKDTKGCGAAVAACCIASFDIFKARHVSSFWRYAGLDVVNVLDADGNVVGEGRGRKHAKYTKREVVDKDTGEVTEVNSLGYNPELRSYLLGGWWEASYVRGGRRNEKDKNGNVVRTYANDGYKYMEIYLDYYNRLSQRQDTKDYPKARLNAMARRYAVKQFIRDMWVTWRELEGLEVTEPYEVAKLGNKPHKYNEAQEEAYLRTRKA